MNDMQAGEIREWNGVRFKSELSYTCQECAFFNIENCKELVKKNLGNCDKSERKTERDDIIFIEVKNTKKQNYGSGERNENR